MLTVLTKYLLAAMLAWAPAADAAARARYESIAADVATVALDPSEPALWRDDTDHRKTALVVLSVAFFESRFAGHIDTGGSGCRAWECDGGPNGLAVTIFQIHPDEGLLFDNDVYQRAGNKPGAWLREHENEVVTRARLLADRRIAVRMALHIIRYSVKRSGGLCAYTGETESGCPKAAMRLDFATRWYRAHPFTPEAAR